jgi:hypothetical protein
MQVNKWFAMIVTALMCAGGCASASGSRSAHESSPAVPPDAVLLEVIPPQWAAQSPEARAFSRAIVEKHILQLQDPDLIARAMPEAKQVEDFKAQHKDPNAALERALHVRIIPRSLIIELYVDRAVAGVDAPRLAVLIANQHLEDERQHAQDKLQETAIHLNNLKTKYQFQLRQTDEDLRELMSELAAPTTRGIEAEKKTAVLRDKIEVMKEERQRMHEELSRVSGRLDGISQKDETAAGEIRLLRAPSTKR